MKLSEHSARLQITAYPWESDLFGQRPDLLAIIFGLCQ
jgi:hypothetical protein